MAPVKTIPPTAARKSTNIQNLERAIKYTFREKGLLIEALTHKSSTERPHNERLEFLGDSVFALLVAEYLFRAGGRMRESSMSKIKSFIVKGAVLAESASALSLGNYLRLGKGEEETGGRGKQSILAGAMEALLGAVYIDGGPEEARGLVLRLFKERLDSLMESGEFHDYKTELQEECQMRYGVLPEYRIVREEGAEHEKIFTAGVYIKGESRGTGRGGSKKDAEARAAEEALRGMRPK